jgi:tetratricopeptide (TPR) repeat protein
VKRADAVKLYGEAVTLRKDRNAWHQAEAKLRAAIQLDPDFGPGYCLLGQLLLDVWLLKENEAPYSETKLEAIGALLVASEFMPDNPEPLFEFCHTREPLTKVKPLYERAIKLPNGLSQQYASAHWALAMIASDEGDRELAVEAFGRALTLDPEQCGMWQPAKEPAISYWLEARRSSTNR